MACCSSNQTCACIIQSDSIYLLVTGSGTATDPYVLDLVGIDWTESFTVLDSSTVNLTLTGGTGGDPLQLRADATVAVENLTNLDVSGAVVGDVIKYLSPGLWEVGAPPVAPAGAVNTSDGILGDGSAPDPIEVAFSGVWGVAPLDVYGVDSTVGLAVYLDSAGEVRAEPRPTAWADITGTPSVFASNAANITDQEDLDVGFILGKQIFTNQNDTTGASAPSTGVNNGDVYIYRKP